MSKTKQEHLPRKKSLTTSTKSPLEYPLGNSSFKREVLGTYLNVAVTKLEMPIMLRKLTSSLIVLPVLLALVFVSSNGSSYSQEASIKFSDANGKSITVEFSEEELRRVEKNARYVVEKLEAAQVKCCEPRKKISDCIWRCCDGSQVRTCNPTLLKALSQVWGEG